MSNLQRHYDALYAHKDAGAEVDAITAHFVDVTGSRPGRVLDVGCGTGNHAICFAAAGARVVGVDIDAESIRVARGKLPAGTENPAFHAGVVQDVAADDDGFDLAIALFHVVNYVIDLTDLSALLGAVAGRLAPGGLFVLDAWNGAAALRDPPREERRQVEQDGTRYGVRIVPTTDFLAGTVDVRNEVEVRRPGGGIESFEFSYQQRLWTPWCLRGLLDAAGLDVLSMVVPYRFDKEPQADTWKIMFVTRKKP